MHRFIVDYAGIENGIAVIEKEELQHLTRVLRLRAGDPVAVFDGNGSEAFGMIETIDKSKACVRLISCSRFKGESPLKLWLVQGIAKGEKMDYIVQKAAELGITGIIPLETERTVVKIEPKKAAEKQTRWQKIAQEAAKQCGRTCIPTVCSIRGISELIQTIPADRLLLIPWEMGGRSLKTVCPAKQQEIMRIKPVYIVIGPEGGLEEKEVMKLTEHGGIPITLGPRILRTETAGIAAIAALMFQWGDLG